MDKKIDEALEKMIDCCYRLNVKKDDLDSCVLFLVLNELNFSLREYQKLVNKYYDKAK